MQRYVALSCMAVILLPLFSAAASADSLSYEELQEIAVDAYIYTYPLLVMDTTRRKMVLPVSVTAIGPENKFNHLRIFPRPIFKVVVRPNFDTLYSSAWVDLADGPFLLTIPSTDGRYFILQMLDMWTDVFAAPGSRTIGSSGARYLIVPPGWSGEVPEDVKRIEAPTPYIWILGRTRAEGKADLPAARDIQNGFTLTSWSETSSPGHKKKTAARNRFIKPWGKPASMRGKEYFTYAAKLLRLHPPHESDTEILKRIERVGLSPTKPFEFSKLDPAVRQAIEHAPQAALKRIRDEERNASLTNGWRMNISTMGVYGNDYLKRAVVAMTALGANAPEDAVYPMADVDANGRPLTGEHRYVLHFEKDALPPVHAFWSITLYNARGFSVDNKLDRYAIGNADPLQFNADGSLDIYVQAESPGKEKEANWLPSPKKEFNLTMRLYWPEKEVLDGTWAPPPVRRCNSK